MTEIITLGSSFTDIYAYISDRCIAFAGYAKSSEADEPTFVFEPYALDPSASFSLNLRGAFRESILLQRHTGRLKVLLNGPVTYVPISEFHEEDAAKLYAYNFPDRRQDQVFYDTLPELNAVLLFSLPVSLQKLIEEKEREVYYFSQVTPMMRHFANKRISTRCKRLFAYFAKDSLDLSVFEDNHLMFSNNFRISTAEDAAYYILHIAQLLAFRGKQDALFVVGKPETEEALMEILNLYMHNVYRLYPSAEFKRDPVAMNEQVPYPLACLLLSDRYR